MRFGSWAHMWRRDKEQCFSPRGQLDRPREFNARVYHYRLDEGRRFGGSFNEGREGQALSLPPLGSTHCVLERQSRVGSRVGLEHLVPASTAPQRSSGMCGARGASCFIVAALGSGDAHRGARGPGALPTSSLFCAQRARATAAIPSDGGCSDLGTPGPPRQPRPPRCRSPAAFIYARQ
ncbi:hypothetical protein NDU88_002822 [Pleurodeles waltl]|uniref:Uncharacterized protein n=1 Tax=Pleurodeles waltl TaxID=8319 RepID=A0AAV7SD41_PLEWA|nr:hypothetical protein NDU88_002822 [Pleurodeles waltl]